jgi:hypothetical protein
VNLTVSWQFTIVPRPGEKRHLLCAAILLFGCVFCSLIWRNLGSLANLAEAVWLAIGVIYTGIKTRGFRSASANDLISVRNTRSGYEQNNHELTR